MHQTQNEERTPLKEDMRNTENIKSNQTTRAGTLSHDILPSVYILLSVVLNVVSVIYFSFGVNIYIVIVVHSLSIGLMFYVAMRIDGLYNIVSLNLMIEEQSSMVSMFGLFGLFFLKFVVTECLIVCCYVYMFSLRYEDGIVPAALKIFGVLSCVMVIVFNVYSACYILEFWGRYKRDHDCHNVGGGDCNMVGGGDRNVGCGDHNIVGVGCGDCNVRGKCYGLLKEFKLVLTSFFIANIYTTIYIGTYVFHAFGAIVGISSLIINTLITVAIISALSLEYGLK